MQQQYDQVKRDVDYNRVSIDRLNVLSNQLRAKPLAFSTKRDILITGVTSGLGRALAKEFAKCGHRVAGFGRRKERIEKLRRELGKDHLFDVCDVSDKFAIDRFRRYVKREGFGIDLLVRISHLINSFNQKRIR